MRSIAPVSIKLTVVRNSPHYCFFRASNTTHMTGLVGLAIEVASIESNQICKQTALDRIDETVVIHRNMSHVAHLRASSSSLAGLMGAKLLLPENILETMMCQGLRDSY